MFACPTRIFIATAFTGEDTTVIASPKLLGRALLIEAGRWISIT
jgi:hypothetical protein